MVKRFLQNFGRIFVIKSPGCDSEKQAKKTIASGLTANEHLLHKNENANLHIHQPEAQPGISLMKLRSFGITDIGLKRSHNEDNFYRSDELGIYLVADGMGGHAAGEVASSVSVKTVAEFAERYAQDNSLTWPFGFDTRLTEEGNALITGIQLANQALCQMQQERPELNGMGTTVAAIRITGNQVLVAHVGDSRVYRFRNGELELLTSDHSWVNEQLQKNIITAEEARTHRYRNVITRALGNRTELEIDVRLENVEPGDCFLLCSDGLSGMVEDTEMQQLLTDSPDCIRSAANSLVARANEAGGHDNISVVIVSCSKDEEASE